MLLVHYLEQGHPRSQCPRVGSRSWDDPSLEAGGEVERDQETGPLPRKDRRAPQPSKLGPYKEIVLARLAACPELSAVRPFEEVKPAGYTGGLTQPKVFVRECGRGPNGSRSFAWRPNSVIRHRSISPRCASRGQAVGPAGGAGLLPDALAKVYPKEDLRVLVSGQEGAFAFFGGVPRELLFDQMASVITEAVETRETG